MAKTRKKTSTKRERVLYRANTHWAILLFPAGIIWFGAWIAGGGLPQWLETGPLATTGAADMYTTLATQYFGDVREASSAISTAVLLIGIGVLLARLAKLYLVKVVITDRRLLMKTGAFRSPLITLPLGSVDRLEVRKSILGRLLNYGRVRIIRPNKVAYHVHWLAAPARFDAFFNRALGNMITSSFD